MDCPKVRLIPREEHRQAILDHLVMMAQHPGAKAYAWHAAKRYEEINPYDLNGLQDELRERMLKEKEAAK
jgi:hypothetical protein